MAINIDYSPFAPAAVGAFQGGLGQYQQRQQELDFRQAMAMIQAQQQAQAHADNVALQAAHMGQAAQQQGFDNWMRANAMQNQVGQQGFNNNLAMQEMGLRRQNLANDEAWRNANLQQRQNDQQQAWDVAGVNVLEDEVAARQKAFGQTELTAEGQQAYRDLAGQLRAIQKQRSELRPDRYQAALGTWLDNFDRAKLENFKVQKPTIDDRMQQQIRPLMIPDGKGGQVFSGHVAVMKPDGSFDTRQIQEPEQLAAAGGQQMPEPHVYFANPEKRAKAFKDAQSELEKEAQAEAIAKSTAENTVTPKAVTSEEVYNRMLERYNADRQFLQNLQGGQGPQPPAQPKPQSPQEPDMSHKAPVGVPPDVAKRLDSMGIAPSNPEEYDKGFLGVTRKGNVPVVRGDKALDVVGKLRRDKPVDIMIEVDGTLRPMTIMPVKPKPGNVQAPPPVNQPPQPAPAPPAQEPEAKPRWFVSEEAARKAQTYGRLKEGQPFATPDGTFMMDAKGRFVPIGE